MRESSPPDIAYPNVNPPELKLKLAVEQPEIGPRSRVPPSNRARVAAEDFFPVAVAEKLERRALPADLQTASTQFPSNALCMAPFGGYLVKCESREVAGSIRHRLVVEDRFAGTSNSVWETEHDFDVVWSWEGDMLSITHWVGDDSSEVLVLYVSERKVFPLPNVNQELESLLSPAQLRTAWMFRAIGWAPFPRQSLVVRGAGCDAGGREYGSEFFVDFGKPHYDSYPAVLLRAYLGERK